MSRGEKRFLLVLFVVLTLWRVFELPGVATAFWNFCTAGQIPGSTHELAPETMIRVWIAVFMLILGGIFHKELIASLPRRVAVDSNGMRIQKKSETKKSPVVIVLPVKKVKTRRVHFSSYLAKLKDQFMIVIRTMGKGFSTTIVSIWRDAVRFMGIAARSIVTFWRWLEPHIRTFDNWINVTVHRNKKVAAALDVADEIRKGLAPVYQTARAKVINAYKRH